MDTLDRTNVVQSALAKWMLTQQLRAVNVLQGSEDVDNFEVFMNKFRNSMSSVYPLSITDFFFSVGKPRRFHFTGVQRHWGAQNGLHSHWKKN